MTLFSLENTFNLFVVFCVLPFSILLEIDEVKHTGIYIH